TLALARPFPSTTRFRPPAAASRCRARARQPEISSIASTACPLGLETLGRQPVTQHVGAITLDLDDPVDHGTAATAAGLDPFGQRSEEHTSELKSRENIV